MFLSFSIKSMYRVAARLAIVYAKKTTVFSNFLTISTYHNPLFPQSFLPIPCHSIFPLQYKEKSCMMSLNLGILITYI